MVEITIWSRLGTKEAKIVPTWSQIASFLRNPQISVHTKTEMDWVISFAIDGLKPPKLTSEDSPKSIYKIESGLIDYFLR